MPRVTGDAARPRALVLAPRALFASFFDAPRERRLRRSFSVSRLEGRTLTPRVLAALAGAQALVTTWDSPTFGDDLPALAPRLRIVAHCGGEVKRRFARPLFERLTITNAPAPMTHYVAELGVAFLLHAARRIDDYREALRRPSNRVYRDLHDHGARGDTLRERRVGLVGFGRIGRALADLLRPFAPRLLVHDPYAPRGLAARHGAAFVSLRRLLATSEFLVLAAGLTEGTRGMIDADALRLLRDGATVVNVARGGLVDLDALTREVRRGRLRCALDVTDPLEPLPARHPLRRARGAVLTPHVGAATVSVRREIADIVLDDLERFFRGERVRNRVHPAMLDRTT